MKLKTMITSLIKTLDSKVHTQFGFKIKDATFNKVVDYMYVPKDASSLAVTRILFGLAMLFDIPDERGGAVMEKRWDSNICHFPLLSFIQPVRMPYMAIVYVGLWIGACGIMLGYKYRVTSILFTVSYWYLFLIEKSFWNNHSYLFGLVALLLTCTDANCFWSIDAYLDPAKKKTTVPYWNYFILKYQFFILYFMAGMKKGTSEWLTGYSVQNLSEHWLFTPFKLLLTVPQTDYLIVHWFVFIFDLTVAVWMMYSQTRHVAMIFCATFHLMNSRLFRIGMFPWVCLATMPLFYPFDWPKKTLKYIKEKNKDLKTYICKMNSKKANDCKSKESNENDVNEDFNETHTEYDEGDDEVFEPKTTGHETMELENANNEVLESKSNVIQKTEVKKQTNTIDKQIETKPVTKSVEGKVCTSKQKLQDMKENIKVDANNTKNKRKTMYLILFYVFLQTFLPYSHFITKGYNNWTNGLYGYSWDMMIHTWNTHSVVLKIIDNSNQKEHYLDPFVYSPNDRWTRHGDMIYQYAKCIKKKLTNEDSTFSKNISIFIDVWCSLNGRFTQRMFDSKFDLLAADWSPFKEIEFLMPLLDESLHWREKLNEMKKEVHSWNNYSDVIFLADFPGYFLEKYIPDELQNVSLAILEGTVAYEPQVNLSQNGFTYKLKNGDRMSIDTGIFHKVLNIGNNPAFYMYTFYNNTENILNYHLGEIKPKLPIELQTLISGINFNLIDSSVFEIIGGDTWANEQESDLLRVPCSHKYQEKIKPIAFFNKWAGLEPLVPEINSFKQTNK